MGGYFNPAALNWPMANVNQQGGPGFSPVQGPPSGQWGNPGNLPNPSSNLKDMIRNAGFLGVQQGQLRNQMIPQFANLMMGYGTGAGDVFKNYANLGSPYYQQKQADVFGQGVGQSQNAAALARQQLQSQGYGATPSGATAAMIGGMNQQSASQLAEQFLQQLFQNEQLQLQGAQGLAGVAGMFNPSSLFGATGPTGTTQGPSAASQFAEVMRGLGIGQGGSSPTYSSQSGWGLG